MRKTSVELAHVTAHIGGGVGAVLEDFLRISKQRGVTNRLLCLDICKDRRALLAADHWGENCWRLTSEEINKMVRGCDAIIWHYWNHPLTSLALHRWQLTELPSIFWAHNSGLYEPHIIPSYLSKVTSRVVFSSQCSFEAPNRLTLVGDSAFSDRVVHSCRSLDQFFAVDSKKDKDRYFVRVVYVGTVSFSKMHQDAAKIFTKLAQCGLQIRVVGGTDQFQLLTQCETLGGGVQIIGPVDDVRHHLEWADIFVYPLRADHYGTGEQVLMEAMASGLPVVAFSNPAERAIVVDGVTGLLVRSSEEFVKEVVGLAANQSRREKMAVDSRRRAMEFFGAERMVSGLMKNIDLSYAPRAAMPTTEELQPEDLGLYLFARNSFHNPKLHQIVGMNGRGAAKQVLEEIRPHLSCLSDVSRWTEASKSTPYHYLMFFPESQGLQELCKLINEEICDINDHHR
jgi:glycosyltransferase involved in cell wall biosynthesis